MKKRLIILSVLLALVAIVASVVPANAATYEEWEFFQLWNGAVKVTATINTQNLQTDYFTVYNNSDLNAYLYVLRDGVIVWSYTSLPHTTVQLNYTIKFRRLPATDPDDPNSIRYPVGYGFMLSGAPQQ